MIRDELEALLADEEAGFLPYVAMEPGTPENKWSPLDHSLDWGALHLWKDGRRNDEACARAPRTAAAVEALPLSDLPGRTPTVFFSLLRPGTAPAGPYRRQQRADDHPSAADRAAGLRLPGRRRDPGMGGRQGLGVRRHDRA